MKNKFKLRGKIAIIYARGYGGRTFQVKIDREDLPLVQRTVHASIRCGREGTRLVPCVIYRVKDRRGVWVWRRLSRLVMGASTDAMVDHEYHDPLDNRKGKLRLVGHVANGQNRAGTPSNNIHSGRRNVHWSPRHRQWQVRLKLNGILKFFGYHRSLKKAALVARQARKKWMPFCRESR